MKRIGSKILQKKGSFSSGKYKFCGKNQYFLNSQKCHIQKTNWLTKREKVGLLVNDNRKNLNKSFVK